MRGLMVAVVGVVAFAGGCGGGEEVKPAPAVVAPVATPVVDAPAVVAPPAIQLVDFDFQGLKIGDPLSFDALKEFCDGFASENSGHPMSLKKIELDGIKVTAFLSTYKGKLASVSLEYSPDSFHTIVAAYTAKFGVPPHKKESEQIQTRAGAVFENLIYTWETKDGPFEFKKYKGNITEGGASLWTEAGKELSAAQAAEKAEGLKSKL